MAAARTRRGRTEEQDNVEERQQCEVGVREEGGAPGWRQLAQFVAELASRLWGRHTKGDTTRALSLVCSP